MALKDAHEGSCWLTWDPEFREGHQASLVRAREQLADEIEQHRFRQFLFFRQWHALRAYAHSQGVKLIGDVPIFIALDSADAWSHPDYFQLDRHHHPRAVAGVPPDYFSVTGQLWGNPLYNWNRLQQTGYAWWVDRMRAAMKMVDLVRVDHFRGFEANWSVPAGSQTAKDGQWIKGPGAKLFEAMGQRLGPLPILAEDLGSITPEVYELMERYQFPGMRVLQFAFSDAQEGRFLPHHYVRNTVVYTGTHDNDTTRGWYASTTAMERALLQRYLGQACDEKSASWMLMRLAWASVANLAVAPLQDILNLGSEARMNFPGRSAGWWRWRYQKNQLTSALLDRLGEMTETFQRN